jgi:hypothetical protein
MSGLHSKQTENHVPFSWRYANATVLGTAVGFVAADIGKFALQEDDMSLHMLVAISPGIAWTKMATSAGEGDMLKLDYDHDDDGAVDAADYATNADTVDNVHAADLVPVTRTVNGLPLSSDIAIETTHGGYAAEFLFCEDVVFDGTTPVWHELEKQGDGGTSGSHTATETSYVELDRYVTAALSSAVVPAGLWSFTLFAKMSAQSGQIKAEIYRVDTAGAIVGNVLGTTETVAFSNTVTVAISCSVFIAEKTGWALTDRIGVVLSGKRIGGSATLTFYHNLASGWASSMRAPITLLHNQMSGLNEGDYRHLTAAQYSDLTDSGETTLHSHAGISGSVATDTIWDTAGDLAVGSGPNTASKLAVAGVTDGWVLTADDGQALGMKWAAPAAGEGGGVPADTVLTDTYANRPAAGTAGRYFLPSDGIAAYRDTGAAWVAFGPVHRLTPPIAGDFTWDNQDTATIVTNKGFPYLSVPGHLSTAVHALYKAAPAVPYVITVGIIPTYFSSDFAGMGICWRQASDGKIVTLSFTMHSGNYPQLRSCKMTNADTYGSDYGNQRGVALTTPFWMRLADDNTNRILSFSGDGINFITFHSVGRTDYITADQVGFFVDGRGIDCGMTVLHWHEA